MRIITFKHIALYGDANIHNIILIGLLTL